MYGDRELSFIFQKDSQDITAGVLGDPIRVGARQFDALPVYFFICAQGEVTATGDPEVEFIIEYADNEDFDDSVEVKLPGKFKKADLYGKGGRPCPCIRMPESPRNWVEPKDVYIRLKAETAGTFACAKKLTAGLTINAQTNW